LTASAPPGCTEADWERFVAFAEALVATGDLDPASVLLKGLADHWDLGTEGRIRLVMLWIAYDHTASVLHFWERHGFPDHRPIPLDLLRLPTSMERRGHRSPRALQRHLEALGARDSWSRTIQKLMVSGAPRASWLNVVDYVATIPGNGRWSSFKAGEMLVEVAGLPLDAPDCRHGESSGPRTGLGLLLPETAAFAGNDEETVAWLDLQTRNVRDALEAAVGYKVPMHQLESILCDYQAMLRGRYWIGHDIELQRQEMEASRFLDGKMKALAYQVRAECFPAALLGELGALDGRDRKALAAATTAGEVHWWSDGLGPGALPRNGSAAKSGRSADKVG